MFFFSPQTLARVVEGWKKHEAERLTFIQKLKAEKEILDKTQKKQQDVSTCYYMATHPALPSHNQIG